MKFWRDLLQKNWAPYTIATCSAVLLYLGLTHIDGLFTFLSAVYSIALPIVFGIIISYVLNPFVQFIQKTLFRKMKSKRWGRRCSVLVVLLTVILLIALLMWALVPQIADSIMTFAENFEGYTQSFQRLCTSYLKNSRQGSAILGSVDSLWRELTDKISHMLSENMGNIMSTSYNIGKGFASGVIACILAVYFLLDAPVLMENIGRLLRVLLPAKKYKDFTGFVKRCNHILLRFIMCDLVEGVVVGVINFIFMEIVGLDYAILISVVVGITNLAPTFGPIVGAVVGAFILVLVNPWYALWFLIFTAILQTIDGYVIKPKLFGDTLGVSSVWILVTLVVGGRMFGVAGIILAIPFAAICDYVFKDIVWTRLETWKERRDEEVVLKKTRKKD